jgi:hypothetical protein
MRGEMNKERKLTRRQKFMLRYYGAWHRKGVYFRGDGSGKWRWPPGVQFGIDNEVEGDPVFAAKMYMQFRRCTDNLATDVWAEEYRPVPPYDGPFPDIAISKKQRETGYVNVYYPAIERKLLRKLRKGRAKILLAHIKEYGIRKDEVRRQERRATVEIYLVNARRLLYVLFNNAEFTEKPFEGARFRRQFGDPQCLTFTFEKTGKGFFLYINFSRTKEPAVLTQITNGQTVGEMQLLLRLADLPRAKIFGSKVLLPDGRSADLIDTVGFELRKVWEGAWKSENNETEVIRRLRLMRLNRLRDEVPGIFGDWSPGVNIAAGKELLFSTRQPADRVLEGVPKVDAPGLPEERNPDELADCDRCEELCYERELTEIEPGLYLCPHCLPYYCGETRPVLVPGEPCGPGSRACDGGRLIFGKGDLNSEFKKPTATDINKAIQLLLWRCRDAEIHKDTPHGKGGFYELDDWMTNANDLMIYELGMWCADIQALNTGSRDS